MEKLTIQIEANGKRQEPVVLEGVVWETVRKGEPSTLTFTVVKDDYLAFNEGDPVKAWYGEKGFFSGFIFQKHRKKDHHIEVTAYDQIRYLKAKTTYLYYGIRADQFVKRVAEDFKLKVGTLENTGFVIPKLDCPNQTIIDSILDAIDLTVMNTNNLFYLYDDFGKLTLKNIKSSKTNFLINDTTAEDYDYTTSIDSNTYNRILLVTKSDSDGAGVPTVVQDLKKIQEWGVLQYYEEIQNGENANAKAKALLKLYNKLTRSFVVENHIGDIQIRAGSGVYLDLKLGDMDAKQHMLVEKATHTFDNGHHYMDLTLTGHGDFYE